MSATNRNINYPWCKAKHSWWSSDAHSENGAGTVWNLFCQYRLPIHPLWITSTKSLVNYRTYRTTNCWLSIEAHFNALSIQHLLLSRIDFIMICLHQLSFCLIKTPPCGEAEQYNILALFTFTAWKMMYHTKRFIELAIHLFMNRYSQATSHHSPIIYL